MYVEALCRIRRRALCVHAGRAQMRQSLSPLYVGNLRKIRPSAGQTSSAKGVRVRLLKSGAHDALVYVYRPATLAKPLARKDVRAFLCKCGYAGMSAEGCLSALSHQVRFAEEFSHEIGVFLDYPLEDVIGFIEHHGSGFLCRGCWKAYGNQEATQRRFALYRKRRDVYLKCYRRGVGVFTAHRSKHTSCSA